MWVLVSFADFAYNIYAQKKNVNGAISLEIKMEVYSNVKENSCSYREC